jgi:hypothetical protein
VVDLRAQRRLSAQRDRPLDHHRAHVHGYVGRIG